MPTIYERVRVSLGHYWEAYVTEKAATPEYQKGVTFDPNFGFDAPRKEREMVATQKEMESASLWLYERDYCAHLAIDYRKCMVRNVPCYWRCKHYKHEWQHCEQEDVTMRYKEYERERRLKKRALTLAGKDFNGNDIQQSAHAV